MTNETSNQNEQSANNANANHSGQSSAETVISHSISETKYQIDIEEAGAEDLDDNEEDVPFKQKSPEEILDMVLSRTEKSISDGHSYKATVERTNFEKSLFVGGVVDWKSYKEADQLFPLFSTEAVDSIEVRFASYQDGLLHLLQHCYGYFYMLKHDSERFEKDIKGIDDAISSMNISSNKGNALEVKIIKLAWRGVNIDRRRVSAYANLIKNAWCKGQCKNGVTDEAGSILPEKFVEQVKLHGGITSFSRTSSDKDRVVELLNKQGYSSESERKLDLARQAIYSGEFKYADRTVEIKPPLKFTSKSADLSNLRNGEVFAVMGKWDSAKYEFNVHAYFKEDARDGIVNRAELEFYNIMMKSAREQTGV